MGKYDNKTKQSHGVIYRAVCIPTGKTYIGQTVNLRKRKYNHLLNSSANAGSLFHKAIYKYGNHNFIWEIITSGTVGLELDYLEYFYILHLKTWTPYGYNRFDPAHWDKISSAYNDAHILP